MVICDNGDLGSLFPRGVADDAAGAGDNKVNVLTVSNRSAAVR